MHSLGFLALHNCIMCDTSAFLAIIRLCRRGEGRSGSFTCRSRLPAKDLKRPKITEIYESLKPFLKHQGSAFGSSVEIIFRPWLTLTLTIISQPFSIFCQERWERSLQGGTEQARPPGVQRGGEAGQPGRYFTQEHGASSTLVHLVPMQAYRTRSGLSGVCAKSLFYYYIVNIL